MSHPIKRQALTLVGLLLLCFALFLGQISCTAPQPEDPVNKAAVPNDTKNITRQAPPGILFAGQVETENGRWPDNHVIVLFKNGQELIRTTSRTLDSPLSEQGMMDGVFELRTTNEYKLTLSHEIYDTEWMPMSMRLVPGLAEPRFIGTWLGRLHPTEMRIISVPDKQLEYAVVVLEMPQDNLPDTHSPGNLSLVSRRLVANQEGTPGGEEYAARATAVPNLNPTAQMTVQFTVLPSTNSDPTWTLQMTGFYGSRWDVWERFLVGRVSGIRWETFKEAVLVYNPQLEGDSYVFYPEKRYLLPMNQ